MFSHDFNRTDSLELKLDEATVHIARGTFPDDHERYLYVPKSAESVTVHTEFGTMTTEAPAAIVLSAQAEVGIEVSRSVDDIYSVQIQPKKAMGVEADMESPPGILMDAGSGVAIYTEHNRLFTVNGETRKSGWFYHSLKISPEGTAYPVGVADVHWPQGVREREVVHYHAKSLETLIPLSGSALLLYQVDDRWHSFRQEPHIMSVAEPKDVHAILEVEGNYRHVTFQLPSYFHDNDRQLFVAESATDATVSAFLDKYGIPPGQDL